MIRTVDLVVRCRVKEYAVDGPPMSRKEAVREAREALLYFVDEAEFSGRAFVTFRVRPGLATPAPEGEPK